VKIPAQRIGQGLRFVMIVQAGEIAPALIAPHFNEPGPEFNPEKHPADDPDYCNRCGPVHGAQEYGIEPNFEQHRFPSEAIKGLSDVYNGQVQYPEHKPNQHGEPERAHIGKPAHGYQGAHYAGPGHEPEKRIGIMPMENTGSPFEAHHIQEAVNRGEAAFTGKRDELVQRIYKCDQIN